MALPLVGVVVCSLMRPAANGVARLRGVFVSSPEDSGVNLPSGRRTFCVQRWEEWLLATFFPHERKG